MAFILLYGDLDLNLLNSIEFIDLIQENCG